MPYVNFGVKNYALYRIWWHPNLKLILLKGILGPSACPRAPILQPANVTGLGGSNPMSLQAMEKLMITEALRCHYGSRNKAARQLGIDPSTLYRKPKALKMEVPLGSVLHQPRRAGKKASKSGGKYGLFETIMSPAAS
jgi:hypothetical protein